MDKTIREQSPPEQMMSANGQSNGSEFDFLTEILKTSPLPIEFAGKIKWTAPLGIDLPKGIAAICCVTHGEFYMVVDEDGQLIQVKAGDVFVLSPAVRHRLQYAPDNPLVPIRDLLEKQQPGNRTISIVGNGSSFSLLLGGLLEFDTFVSWPLQWILPPIIHLRRHEIENVYSLERIIRLMEYELSLDEIGQQGIINRLIEILFIRIVQLGLVEANPPCLEPTNAILHPDLAPTLALIHREPEKPWTVAALAEQAAMSRSTFSATFLKVLGKPPLQYLRDHRMQLACRLLHNPTLGLKEIASRVGYDSSSAFSTAFKRVTGMHPSGYRHREMQRECKHSAEHPSGEYSMR